MKKYVCFAIFTGAILLFSGCMQKQKELTVRLDGNPSTGYIWTYEMSAPGILKETGYEYIDPNEDDTAPPMLGAAGEFVWTFEGVGSGKVELLFTYAREFEEEGLLQRLYVLEVDKNKNVTIVLTEEIELER